VTASSDEKGLKENREKEKFRKPPGYTWQKQGEERLVESGKRSAAINQGGEAAADRQKGGGTTLTDEKTLWRRRRSTNKRDRDDRHLSRRGDFPWGREEEKRRSTRKGGPRLTELAIGRERKHGTRGVQKEKNRARKGGEGRRGAGRRREQKTWDRQYLLLSRRNKEKKKNGLRKKASFHAGRGPGIRRCSLQVGAKVGKKEPLCPSLLRAAEPASETGGRLPLSAAIEAASTIICDLLKGGGNPGMRKKRRIGRQKKRACSSIFPWQEEGGAPFLYHRQGYTVTRGEKESEPGRKRERTRPGGTGRERKKLCVGSPGRGVA